MTRSAVAIGVFVLTLLAGLSGASGQVESPLIGDEFNCPTQQTSFGGQPQSAIAGETLTVSLSTECFLVVGVPIEGGEDVRLTYLSGQYQSLNIAFYAPGARPGAAFLDPANPTVGTVSAAAIVPGSGPTTVLIAVQGEGGPTAGSAAIRIDSSGAAPTTTVAPSTTEAPAPSTSVAADQTADQAEAATAVEPAGSAESTAADAAEETAAAAPAVPVEGAEANGDGGGGLPWWLLAGAVLAAFAWLGWISMRPRRGSDEAKPWDRAIVSWTLQHGAPTGGCSSAARALVDPADDGMFSGYSITALFALPSTGKRVRSTVADPLLSQLDAIWATEGSGEELHSAVEAYVNTLCRHLDRRRIPADATLLTEMTKPDVVVHGEVHACVDGRWEMFEGWRDVPDLPDGQIQHDIVQVAVLGVGGSADTWLDRSEQITTSITELVETRRAPAGLWVFD